MADVMPARPEKFLTLAAHIVLPVSPMRYHWMVTAKLALLDKFPIVLAQFV